ncbi:MAG: hypothetical protein ACE5G2_06780 [Candidatus Krumholzibacteriia bacterium]
MHAALRILLVCVTVSGAVWRAHCQNIDDSIGVDNEMGMTRTSGILAGGTKDLYVGFKMHPESYHSGFRGFEFSISNLHESDYSFEALNDPTVPSKVRSHGHRKSARGMRRARR